MHETISISTSLKVTVRRSCPSFAQISPLITVCLPGTGQSSERPQPPCTSFSFNKTGIGSDLILFRSPSLRTVVTPLLCIITGLNPMTLIFPVVALPPTRPLAETPRPQQFRHKSTILLESCATTSQRWRNEEKGWTNYKTRPVCFLRPSAPTTPAQHRPGCSACEINLFYSCTVIDNLAISAQGFRRGADRVRKVCVLALYFAVLFDSNFMFQNMW